MLRFAVFALLLVCAVVVKGQPKVPCYFIFGDSLSDVGNNNDLRTMAKANYAPYGVDYPGEIPTGRFSNGLTIEDYIAKFLGFNQSIVPYSDQMNDSIVRGVNYASGGAGILDNTGSQLGDRIWLNRQIQRFLVTIVKLQFRVQGPVSKYLNKCLYTVNIGSNDYLNNYFMPQYYLSQRLFTPEQFANLLIAQYRVQLRTLYNFGARMVAVFGLGQLGCTPAQIILNNATQCVEKVNQASNVFNTKLDSLVKEFNTMLPGANFTFISLSAMAAFSPLPQGIITNSTCCQLRSDFQCVPNSPPCANRNIYAYFDGYHPTGVINAGVADTSYNTQNRMIATPLNINELTSTQLEEML